MNMTTREKKLCVAFIAFICGGIIAAIESGIKQARLELRAEEAEREMEDWRECAVELSQRCAMEKMEKEKLTDS